MILGTIVGSVADQYGRKICCMIFGVVYSLSCVTKATAAHCFWAKLSQQYSLLPLFTSTFCLTSWCGAWQHSSDYWVLMVGRLLGGVATSLLFSVFEVRWVELFVFSNVSHGMLPHFLVVDDRFALQGRLQRRSAR